MSTQVLSLEEHSSNEVRFDREANIKRIVSMKNSDSAFFFLAMISFIEGYLRNTDKKFSFISESEGAVKWGLSKIIDDKINTINKSNKLSDREKTDTISNLKQIQNFSSDSGCGNIYKISGNRIRHTFCKQYDESVRALIQEFVKFAENYRFVTPEIRDLLQTQYFDNIRAQKNSQNSEALVQENNEHEERLRQLDEENVTLKQKIKEYEEIASKKTALENENEDLRLRLQNATTDSAEVEGLAQKLAESNRHIQDLQKELDENTKNAEIGDKLIEYLFHKEQLEENQSLLSMWSKSWRDYNKQMFRLTDEQEGILNEIKTSINSKEPLNYLIQGGPGTGKTIILIHLLKNYIDSDICMLTYTSSLNKYNQFIANLFFSDESSLSDDEKQKIKSKINVFDEFMQKKAGSILKKEVFIHSPESDYTDKYSEKVLEIIGKILNQPKYRNLKKSSKYVYREALANIWGLMPSKNDYADTFYSTEEHDSEKIAEGSLIWDAVLELSERLDKEKVIPLEYACYKLSLPEVRIENSHMVDYILIDEVQDLCQSKIAAIIKLARKNYVITGDLSQSLFIRKGLSWKKITEIINDKKASYFKALQKNFRSSVAIQNLANSFWKMDDFRVKDDNVFSEGFMPGPTPDYTVVSNETDCLKAVKERIKILKEKMYFSNKDFCIIAANDEELKAVQENLGDEFPFQKMEDKNFNFTSSDNTIRLSTVKYIKGIDCPVVLLLLSKNYINQKTNGNLDKYSQMNGLYACMTRAMNILSIFINENDGNGGSILDSDNTVSKLYKVLEQLGVKN